MIRRPRRSTLSSSSAASDVYKRQVGEEPYASQHAKEVRWGLSPLSQVSAACQVPVNEGIFRNVRQEVQRAAQEKAQVEAAQRVQREAMVTQREVAVAQREACLLYTSPSPRDRTRSRMPSSA
eukprot:TRINITY_DN46295_c0_g1_i1.p1 TRINITY_DN46295_c0_g1~~TRINITY_DN46295_c0_g1_i1.p1  ORF type:complete len:123 (-),score=32.54 TRINITY_DN46295_c0_g1_i1:34-402(-)